MRNLRTVSSVLAACVMVFGTSQAASAQPLPEGNTGIAALYPNDTNIGSDPRVVFHENFEGIASGSLSASNSAFDNVYGGNSITQVSANVHSGSRAVERTATSTGSFGGIKYLGTGYDTLHLRYYMKYHALFPGSHHAGGVIYAAAGSGMTQTGDITGVRPNGTNQFQVWLDAIPTYFSWSPSGNDTPPGWLDAYTYSMDQSGQYGDVLLPDGVVIPGNSGVSHGSNFVSRPNFVSDRDRWISFELMVKANTPGQTNGRIAIWVDGQLVADFPNMRFRSSDSLKINHLGISTYASQVHQYKTVWYDDVVAATSYIGPMLTAGSGGVPSAPTNLRIVP